MIDDRKVRLTRTATPPPTLRFKAAFKTTGRVELAARWLYFFVAMQLLCQALLVAEPMGTVRTLLRVLSYASSLAMFIVVPPSLQRSHPARAAAITLFAIMSFGIFHVDTSFLAGIAHWVFVFSIWAPLFWAGRLNVSARAVWNMLLMLWAFHWLSSLAGVLQVYFPERFSPSASFAEEHYGAMADAFRIKLADGSMVWRPFGLSDSPGGAANSGTIAVVVGIPIITLSKNFVVRFLGVVGIGLGSFCLYISEFRSLLISTALSSIVLIGLQVLRARTSRAAALVLILALIVGVSIGWTNVISGENAQKRVKTLGENTITTVFYQNRGRFIEYSIGEIPDYPVGAGLGRYGMMFNYFGDKRIAEAKPLYAEIQLTAWLYDAGVIGIILGYGSMLCTCYISFAIAVSRRSTPQLAECAAVTTALNAAWIAVTFAYPLFMGQSGMLFWLLNAALYQAAAPKQERRPLVLRRTITADRKTT